MRGGNSRNGAAMGDEREATTQAAVYSVHILLPESLERRLAEWTEKTPGASWPVWGGHISLLTRFTTPLTLEELEARVDWVCRKFAPLALEFGDATSVRDVTRPGYHAVFLVLSDPDANASAALFRLRAEIDAQLAEVRAPVREELDGQAFLPHITLALGLSEAEAQTMVNTLRSDGLRAAFSVDAVWLIVERPDRAPEQRRIALSGEKAIT